MEDSFLEEQFKTLIYDFGESNWEIIKEESWEKYIIQDKPFNEKQLKGLRQFVEDLISEIKHL